MKNELKQIEAGQTLTGRSVCDYECIFSALVVDRKGAFATIKFQNNLKRVKVHQADGSEFIFPSGRYSMAPILRAA